MLRFSSSTQLTPAAKTLHSACRHAVFTSQASALLRKTPAVAIAKPKAMVILIQQQQQQIRHWTTTILLTLDLSQMAYGPVFTGSPHANRAL